MKELWFATSNPGKFKEVAEFAGEYGITLHRADIELPEIRGDLEAIAEDKARKAYEAVGKPVVVEDSGLFVRVLGGFPGQFSAFALKTIGIQGLLVLMAGKRDRFAEFRACAAYCDGDSCVSYAGRCAGSIIDEAQGRGTEGFGYDPVFLPADHDKTFAEDLQYKQRVSHRTQAYRQLFTFLTRNNPE